MSTSLSVVVPALNEADNLERLHGELAAVLDTLGWPAEIVFVDDGSTDGTAAVLAALRERDPRVGVVTLARRTGQTAALAAGFAAASGDVVVTLDADGQNDPADIPALLARLGEGADVVAGWRVERQDAWLTRVLPSRAANALIGAITGVRLRDYGCTLKAYRRWVTEELRLYGELHRFIPALAAGLGALVVEMPVRHRPRWSGRSKYGLMRTPRVLLDLIAVTFLTNYATRPIQVFGGIGLLSTAAGLAITATMGIRRLLFGVPLAQRPVVWLGILLTLMGLQFVSMGLLGELLVRTYHEAQGKPVYRTRSVCPPRTPAARRAR